MKTFKDELRRYLKKTKTPASHLSIRAGISPAIISLFLRNKRDMTVTTMEKIKAVMK